ncbi:hypothetical protein D3C80_1550610 [compost metagenome]
MPRRHPLEGHPAEEYIGYILTRGRVGQQRDVEFVVVELAVEHRTDIDGDLQGDLWEVRLYIADYRRQPDHRRTFVRAQAQAPVLFLLRGKLLELRAVVEHLFGVAQSGMAICGEAHALLAAVEQLDAEQRFHFLDTRRHCRLRQVKMTGGGMNAPEAGGPVERLDLHQRDTHDKNCSGYCLRIFIIDR